jgi:hypothetical protein
VEKIEECVSKFVVACSFRCITKSFEWPFACVYGLDDDVERKCL